MIFLVGGWQATGAEAAAAAAAEERAKAEIRAAQGRAAAAPCLTKEKAGLTVDRAVTEAEAAIRNTEDTLVP